jgi:hypothetical protein
LVQSGCVTPGAIGESLHSLLGQWEECEAMNGCRGGEITEHQA